MKFRLSKMGRVAVTRISLIPIVIGLAFCSGCSNSTNKPTTPPPAKKPKLDDAFALHRQGKTADAFKIVQQALIADPVNTEALSLACQLHEASGQFCEAGRVAEKLAQANPASAVPVLLRAFDWYLRCHDQEAAEASLRRAAKISPNTAQVHRLIAQLLNAQGRRVESRESVIELIRLRDFHPNEILSLIDLSGPFSLVDFGDLSKNPEISLFDLGKARLQYGTDANPVEVLALVEKIRTSFGKNTSTAAFQGRLFADLGRHKELTQWLATLPAGIETQPEYWYALGVWLVIENRHNEAIRAFGEAMNRDPTDRKSLRAMIRSLEAVGQESKTQPLRDHLATLDKIFRVAKDADAEQSQWIAEELHQLTRPWEAFAWMTKAAQLSGRAEQIPKLQQRHQAISAWESGSSIEQIRNVRLQQTLGFDIESFPLPTGDSLQTGIASIESQSDLNLGLEFSDVASSVGLSASFDSGYPLDDDVFLLYQANGGGLAAFDYDLDGRCDVYIAQSGGTPLLQDSTANQLFRLLPEQRYEDITAASATGDQGFSQGVCAGDVNQDGFPDLLIANIGTNTLLINQGDGTFRTSDESIEANQSDWTSSLGLADLDGDHLPEIIEVNYIDDPKAYRVKCEGRHIHCQPQRFTAASDRVHQNVGDGSFRPWPSATQFRDKPNYGFGLIIANFDQQHGNDVFVSNDGDLNHYWVSRSDDENPARHALIESAGVRGCSIGANGISQACMGIAAGDFDRNGTLDLHITNFHNESVNLFLQSEPGFFSDESLRYRLTAPSLPMLGFGTQAADFDNDGWLDLAVANGHIYDARYANIPFRMKSQLFRGSGQGFTLQDQDSAGAYWRREQLARTIATIDFNRDGRVDLVANHLDQPIALLQNESPAQNWLQLELIGVESERDAIGAKVRLQASGQAWTAWQTGGDGLMCTNEPVIHIGIGNKNAIDIVTITWPSGTTQEFQNVAINRRYLCVEGNAELFARE